MHIGTGCCSTGHALIGTVGRVRKCFRAMRTRYCRDNGFIGIRQPKCDHRRPRESLVTQFSDIGNRFRGKHALHFENCRQTSIDLPERRDMNDMRFRGDYSFLSNFYDHEMCVNGISVPYGLPRMIGRQWHKGWLRSPSGPADRRALGEPWAASASPARIP